MNTILKFYSLAADVDSVPQQCRDKEARPQPVDGNITKL